MRESTAYNLIATVGLLLLSAGAWMAYRPAGLLLPGVVLLSIGVIGSAQVKVGG